MKGWLVAAACVVVAAAVVAGVALGTGGKDAADGLGAPDVIVHNGRITTLDDRNPTVQALAIRDGEIVASGTDDDVEGLAGDDTRVIDLGGRRVIPGLVDAYLHGVTKACYSRSPRFDATFKRADALREVADRAQRTPASKWLFQLGTAWHVEQFDVSGMLTREELDALAPSHPVYLQAAGFEGGQLNSRGMRMLGLRVGDPGVARGATGGATGQVTGPANARALGAIDEDIAALTGEEQEVCTRDFIRELNRRGLTAWDDPGGDGDFDSVSRLHRAGELNARVRLNFSCPPETLGLACVEEITTDQIGELGDDNLRVGGVGDEVLQTGAKGVYPPAPYRRILTRIASSEWGFEHAAPRATTQQGMLGEWERVNAAAPITELRWRMLRPGGGPTQPSPDSLARLAALNAGVVPADIGILGGNEHPPYRGIYESEAQACLGSGAPGAAPYAPFANLWYTISGKTYDPAQGGVREDERLSREQALELATKRCAWFMSLDNRIGTLAVGRLADLLVLSGDYFRVPEDEIRSLTSVLTMVGGRVVYGEGGFADLESTASTIE